MTTERRALAALVAAGLLALAGTVAAHATLVFGTVDTDPAPPPADAPFALILELNDPVDAPVEDALVHVEATLQEGERTVVSDPLEEIAPGRYRTELTLPETGAWTLTFRDRTFRQEEARAEVTLHVGPGAPTESAAFIFPPTATGTQSLATWLIWLIGLPLLAGAVVTVMVLRGGSAEEDDEDDTADGDGPGGPSARGPRAAGDPSDGPGPRG